MPDAPFRHLPPSVLIRFSLQRSVPPQSQNTSPEMLDAPFRHLHLTIPTLYAYACKVFLWCTRAAAFHSRSHIPSKHILFLLRKLVPISQEKMGLFSRRIIKGPTEHLYPRHAYRPISTKLPRGGNCPAFFGLDRCVRKKRDSLRRDPRLPAPLTVVARAGGSPIFAPICCIPPNLP